MTFEDICCHEATFDLSSNEGRQLSSSLSVGIMHGVNWRHVTTFVDKCRVIVNTMTIFKIDVSFQFLTSSFDVKFRQKTSKILYYNFL